MANENDKGDTKWEGQRVRWGHTKRGNAEGGQGGHRGVLSVKLNPFNGLHLSSCYYTVATHRFGPVSEGVPNRLIVADQGCSLSHF